MLQDPGVDRRVLASALRDAYGMEAHDFTFVPGFDMRAASYVVSTTDGRIFIKVSFGPVAEAPLEVSRALRDLGVRNVLAPIRAVAGSLTHPMGEQRTLVVYPHVAGRNATEVAMSVEQWRTYGTALRAIHGSGLEERFASRLPQERFALPSADALRDVLARRPTVESPVADRFHAFLGERRDGIGDLLERAAELGRTLADRHLANVLCHGDIHAANLLVGDDGSMFLVDWDTARIAPRERDLLFVIGSRIARPVEPHEEAWFFEGYGSVDVDPDSIVYFRYERIIEDIGEFARSVFTDADLPESSREAQLAMTEGFFESGGDLESVEQVVRR